MNVGQKEILTQQRVVTLFREQLRHREDQPRVPGARG